MKKEQIQGMGDVRFSFIEQELNQMRKQFGPSTFEQTGKKAKALIWEESHWEEDLK
jgi:ABC-type sulfate transport system substrate-binding protein